MSIADNTPVIVGVGQFTERLNSPEYQALSSYEIAAAASSRAFSDALSAQQLSGMVDVIAATRTFEDSTPARAQPFGKSNNFPRSIARRLNIHPPKAIWERAGGDSPQRLMSEMFERVAAGEFRMALVTGAENISSARHLKSEGKTADWAETVEGEVENRGLGLKGLISRVTTTHRLGAPSLYALTENARRGRLKMSRNAYASEMGRLFAPFTQVAAANPHTSSDQRVYRSEELITVGAGNRMIADPYPQRLVARDQVNQGAAIIVTTVGLARQLGIPEAKWVYLHGYSDMTERPLIERQELGESPAAKLASCAALAAAGVGPDNISFFDFYSCFPSPVFNAACDGLGLSPDDKRGLTVTGGLPYFGGPGNNYSMHAIATMVEKLREKPDSMGFVGANGGYLSKYSVGIYSTRPKAWQPCDSSSLQAQIDALPAPDFSYEPHGEAIVESYTTVFAKGMPDYSVVVGRLVGTHQRFLANSVEGDVTTMQHMLESDPLGQRIWVVPRPQGNRFAFSQTLLTEFFPKRPPALREHYLHCIAERKEHLLEVTINRPEVRNCLHPMANDELAEIFDAFEADPTLWVAIVTGAGIDAFSAGNDLKYTATGAPMWFPQSGFGGLTKRQRSKPVIAAVNGYAMGGGTEMALACDIVVADESASFALSEVRVGLFAGAGGLVRLPRQIPKKIATELILTGRKLPACKAHEYGLVNRIMPRGQAMDGAREIAREILEASPTSVRLSMQIMDDAETHASELDALRHAKPKFVDDLITTEDYLEGLAAFAQKRQPSWKNR